ncbi:MAG: biotin--[acetyl-CoA-carboxylase] ligase [Actinobacteria bacterium]|nr:biotin--[acetyl-CoA-carboxylase] ligase [Actinomycetota bacterium]
MLISTSRRAQVAAALAAAGPAGVSGEAIAADLGVSRVAVSKHVAALRALGYKIAAAPRAGYRLESAPDACIPEEVGPRLRDPLWIACEGAAEVTSTNDDAKRLARARAPEGVSVVAARQTAGRGRLGRVWESPAGGAYVSCVLRPAIAPAEAAPLSLVVAAGVARGLRAAGVDAGIKWPNDLMLDDRKLGGILLEMSAEADRVEWVVVGCGINVGAAPGPDGAFVREAVSGARVAEIAAAVLDGIAAGYREFLQDGFGPARVEVLARDTLAGRPVTVRDAAGVIVAEGVAAGVSDSGELLLDGAGGQFRVAAGEVTLRC